MQRLDRAALMDYVLIETETVQDKIEFTCCCIINGILDEIAVTAAGNDD